MFLTLSTQKFYFFKSKSANSLEFLLLCNVHHSRVWDNLRVGAYFLDVYLCPAYRVRPCVL